MSDNRQTFTAADDQGPWLITVTPVPDDPRTPILVSDDYEGLSTRCPDCDGHIMSLDEDEAFVYGLADTMAGHVCPTDGGAS